VLVLPLLLLLLLLLRSIFIVRWCTDYEPPPSPYTRNCIPSQWLQLCAGLLSAAAAAAAVAAAATLHIYCALVH
jgi:hypothetical protein